MLEAPLGELGFTPGQIGRIVVATRANGKDDVGFTFSDLTQRLLPTLLLEAKLFLPIDDFENMGRARQHAC